MITTIAQQKNTEVSYVCDVDSRTMPKAIKLLSDKGYTAETKAEKDCRKIVANKSIDAIYIATPDHWHTPLTILGCQVGKACL